MTYQYQDTIEFDTNYKSQVIYRDRVYKRLGYLYKPGNFDADAVVYIDQDLIFHVSMNGKILRYRSLYHILSIFHKDYSFCAG